MTNGLGFFSYDIPDADSVRILISHLGYKRLDTLVSTLQSLYFALEPSAILMQAIEVKQVEKQVLEATPDPEKIAFNPLKSANAPRMSSDDLANALLIIPGVNFSRGVHRACRSGRRTHRQLGAFRRNHGARNQPLLGNMSVLNSKFVQQAFVSRGGFDAEFGGRAAGLIELTGKSGKNNRPYLDVSANLMNSNVLANIPVTGKFQSPQPGAVRLSIRGKTIFTCGWWTTGPTKPATSLLSLSDVTLPGPQCKVSFHPSDKLEMNVIFCTATIFKAATLPCSKPAITTATS
jgi:hypothetical protein